MPHSQLLCNCLPTSLVVELEEAEDGEVSEEDEEGVQHDDTTLDHQRIV